MSQTVYCPECEAACSEADPTCPLCGHQLQEIHHKPHEPTAIEMAAEAVKSVAATARTTAAHVADEVRASKPVVRVKRTLSRKSRAIIAGCNVLAAVIIATVYFSSGRRFDRLAHEDIPYIRSVGELDRSTGLGWSLARIEENWGAEAGWYWSEKRRPDLGIGIDYTASNTDLPSFKFRVIGVPENLSTFIATVTVPLRYVDDDETLLMYLAVPAIMVGGIAGTDAGEFGTYVGKELGTFYEMINTGGPYKHVAETPFGRLHLRVGFVVTNDEYLIFSATVTDGD